MSTLLRAFACILSFIVVAEARGAETSDGGNLSASREAGKPVVAVIGLRQQKITVYDLAGAVMQARVSTGRRTYDTPAGIFTVLQKNRDHVSNLYEDAEMPFMQRLTWSGVALHAGPLPGYRASHGCIRLPYAFAERLFDLTSIGTRVVIAPSNVDAADVSHPVLEQLRRAATSSTAAEDVERARELATSLLKDSDALAKRASIAAADARRAEAKRVGTLKRLDVAMKKAKALKLGREKDRAELRVDKLRADAASSTSQAMAATSVARAAKADHTEANERARKARLKAWPISIMVSLSTQRIYVRQGFEPVLELPAVIRDPRQPIGTHAFYASETPSGDRGWLGVALDGNESDTARQVLDRIELPKSVTDKLADSTWFGSALIVSDEAPYKETASGTDFIVVLGDQPQGALKIREPTPRGRPIAQGSPPKQPTIRAYRSAQDHHFRHPLGFP